MFELVVEVYVYVFGFGKDVWFWIVAWLREGMFFVVLVWNYYYALFWSCFPAGNASGSGDVLQTTYGVII